MKVVDKITEAVAACDGDAKGGRNRRAAVFSLEFFTPRKAAEVDGLLGLIGRLVAHGPAFCDLTWRSGSLATDDLTLDVMGKMQNEVRVETMMHLTCTNMAVQRIDRALERIKSDGVQNVLALRGDPPPGQDKFVPVPDGFASGLELVEHIRAKYGDYFGITVAGYPEGHPDVIGSEGVASDDAYQNELAYLKRKLDAGADLIITQLFFDTDIFLKFVNDCRQVGITCPIVPGIMPIATYKGFVRMTGMCKTKIPAEVSAALEPIKHNDEAVRNFGIHLGTEMCRKILASGIKTLHMYTFNKEASALAILMNLGLIEEARVSSSLPQRHTSKVLPVEEDQHPNSERVESANISRPRNRTNALSNGAI